MVLNYILVGCPCYASATFVSRENHNSIILLQAFESLFHVFSYIRLRWLRFLEKIINSSPDLTESACSVSNGLIADSTLATISVAGILVGVIAKFNPFCSSKTSVSLKDLEDRLITHTLWSIQGVLVGERGLSPLARVYQICVVVGLWSY